MAALLGFMLVGQPLLRARAQTPGFASSATSPGPIHLERATEVVQRWQPQQHLYVKGNVGASPEALAGLETWLRAEATNWVVVLAENADGESYTDAEGRSYQGVEAVNHAMGKGLISQTAFGQQTDPRTQERDAAFFILFLKEHKLSYFGSDAQDRRGLGEDHWPGNLDQPAVSAMRNGARVVDAAKDAIANINRRLASRINAENEARKQRAAAELAARNQAIEEAKAALEDATKSYQLLETKSGELSRNSAGLTGDLAQPDLAGLRAELQTGRTAFEQNDTTRARRSAEAVRNRSAALLRQLDQYGPDRKEFESLAARLTQAEKRPHADMAVPQLRSARAAAEQARRQYERADSSYVLLLRNANTAVSSMEATISAAQVAAERERLLLVLFAISAFVALAATGLFLNHRRLPARNQARELYDLWDHALREKVDALFRLLDRRATFVGTSGAEAAQRYSGETLKLAQELVQDVDELFIMSSCAGRILQEAKGLLEPTSASAKLTNLFLAARYRQCIALLREQPIAFQPEEGLELVVRGARAERDRLIGDLKSYQAFTMTFNQLVDAFNLRAERALASLDQVENTLKDAPELLRNIQTTLDSLRAKEGELAAGAAQDGWLGLCPVFEKLVPSAQAALLNAVKSGISDPVGALRTDGAKARQQARDAETLVELASNGRKDLLPIIQDQVARLSKSGLSCAWIAAELRQLSKDADNAAARALDTAAETEIAAVRETQTQLGKRVQRTVELDGARREQCQPQLEQVAKDIGNARQKIGAALGKNPAETLCERDRNPSDLLQQARAQFAAVAAALDRGDLDAAANAIQAVGGLTSTADAIVTASLEALARQADTLAALRQEWRRVGDLVPEHARVLADIQATYTPAVMDLDAGDPAHPDANRTVADNIQETEAHLAAVREALDNADKIYQQGGLLQSADLLRQAKARLEIALHRLAEIMEKRQRLAATEAVNREQLQQLEETSRQCAKSVDESTTMAPTQQAFAKAATMLEQARAAVSASMGNPFEAATVLLSAKEELESVADSARCDKDVFEQAGRSLASAGGQLAGARRVAAQAAGDQIPDSAAIRQAVAEIESLEANLNAARQGHAQPHGDWHAVDEAANGVANRAAAATATLRGELEHAREAMAALSTAASLVRSAGAWTGPFGVNILGTPGSDLLTQARGYLERGEYESARRQAESARRTAERAIAQAEAEVQQRRYAEQQRLEAERRRRQAEEQARSWSQSSSSSSWGSLGSSSFSSCSSWGSSGSGASTSSFSSGSGVSTSSW